MEYGYHGLMTEKMNPRYIELTQFGKCVINRYLEHSSSQLPVFNTAQEYANYRDFILIFGGIKGIITTLDEPHPITREPLHPAHSVVKECRELFPSPLPLDVAAIHPSFRQKQERPTARHAR